MKKYFLPLFLLLLLILALSLTVVFISQRTSWFGQAYGPERSRGAEGGVSVQNSYLFASPLSASAAGKEKIRVTVFVLDDSGRGVYGQPVSLGENERLTVGPIQAATDSLGRAIFDISSTQAAEYFLEARVGNQVLPQRIKLRFY